jgi:hypothetical protein
MMHMNLAISSRRRMTFALACSLDIAPLGAFAFPSSARRRLTVTLRDVSPHYSGGGGPKAASAEVVNLFGSVAKATARISLRSADPARPDFRRERHRVQRRKSGLGQLGLIGSARGPPGFRMCVGSAVGSAARYLADLGGDPHTHVCMYVLS